MDAADEKPDNACESSLWDAWQEKRDSASRQALVQHYYNWTCFMARRVFMRVYLPGVEWADYVHYATIGLLEAIDRFEPERGLKFTTYARHRVRGAILNGIRQFQDLTRPHRSRHAERADSMNSGENGNALEEIVEVSVGLAIGYLLDLESQTEVRESTADTYTVVENNCLIEDISRFVGELPEREQKIVRLHYYHHMPFVEIADLMELTKGRISQLHKQAINRIRKHLDVANSWNLVA